MDSLLYLGAGDAEDGEEDAGEEEDREEELSLVVGEGAKLCTSGEVSSSSSITFESLVRAGYSGESANLSQTGVMPHQIKGLHGAHFLIATNRMRTYLA